MKRILAFSLIICTVFCLVACKRTNNNDTAISTLPTVASISTTPTTEPVKTPLHRQSFETGPKLSFDKILDTFGKNWNDETALDIPVYYEYDLLFDNRNQFHLTRDSALTHNLSSGSRNNANKVYAELPTSAWRIHDDGSSYAVYDTDTGYRFFLFFLSDTPHFTSFPVVIRRGNVLSYNDFKDIQIGDSIEKIEAVDATTSLYKKELLEIFGYTSAVINNCVDMGTPCASIHYLKDGILKFEYMSPSDGNLAVYRITFYEDFIITTMGGDRMNHKIKDIDLPIT